MKQYNLQHGTIRKVVREISEALAAIYGEREAAAMAWIMLETVSRSRRGQLIARGEEPLQAPQLRDLAETLDSLLAGVPLQYALGQTRFYGFTLQVNASALIPRQETEELVDWIIRSEGSGKGPEGRETSALLDIGTGTGCIAIALKKNLPGADVLACDVSEGALALARGNARLNEAEISFSLMDILDERAWELLPMVDLVVSNPPYVTQSEKSRMAANVLDHEPHLALFVKDEDPLCFYRKITAFAKKKLRAGGKLYFEINETFGPESADLLKRAGFHRVELRKDLNGKDRMVRGFI